MPTADDDFSRRLAEARARQAAGQAGPVQDDEDQGAAGAGLGMAMRAGVELAVGVGVGVLIGVLVGRATGLIALWVPVGLVLGLAAGVLNVWRMANGYGSRAGFTGRDAPEQGADAADAEGRAGEGEGP